MVFPQNCFSEEFKSLPLQLFWQLLSGIPSDFEFPFLPSSSTLACQISAPPESSPLLRLVWTAQNATFWMLQPALQILQKWGQQKRIRRGKKCSSGMLELSQIACVYLKYPFGIKKHLENIWNGRLYFKKNFGRDWTNLLYITFRADQSVFFLPTELVGISSDFLLVRGATVMRISAPWRAAMRHSV